MFISPLFFRGDGCSSCGACCKSYILNYTESGYKQIQQTPKEEFEKWGLDYADKERTLSEIEEISVEMNGRKVPWYILKPGNSSDKGKRSCRHLKEVEGKYYCKIHPIKALPCILPHIVVRTNRQTATSYLRKQQFGRNWALGCPVEFAQFNYEKFRNSDLPTLYMWKDIAEDLGVKTYLPDILKTLEGMDKQLQKGILPKEPIEITNKTKQKNLFNY